MPDTTSAAGPNTDKGSKDSDAIRVEALRYASHAQQAQDTLARLEEQLKSCDESISSHRAALVLHKQQLTADKSKRAELTDTLTRQRKDTARAVKQARKADAKYDKALLAQLVIDAKAAAAAKARPAKKTAAARSSAAVTTAKPTSAAPRIRKTTANRSAPAGS